jgi:hypothetical protein
MMTKRDIDQKEHEQMSTTASITADEEKLTRRLKGLKRLKSYEGIDSPASAPAGSELARLVGEAAAAVQTLAEAKVAGDESLTIERARTLVRREHPELRAKEELGL